MAQIPVALIRKDFPDMWKIGALTQTTDSAGTLILTNQTNVDAVVSCSYSLTIE